MKAFKPILAKSVIKYGFRDILNNLKPGEFFIIRNEKEHNALRQFCYQNGFVVVTRKEGKSRRVWRLG